MNSNQARLNGVDSRMVSVQHRLASFQENQGQDDQWNKCVKLAQAGFYCIQSVDTNLVQCYVCQVQFALDLSQVDFVQNLNAIHTKNSANCALVRLDSGGDVHDRLTFGQWLDVLRERQKNLQSLQVDAVRCERRQQLHAKMSTQE